MYKRISKTWVPSFFHYYLLFTLDPRIEEGTLLKPTVLLISNFNEVQTLKAYVQYARENIEKSSDVSLLWKFLNELSARYDLNDLNGLIDEFMSLERKYFEFKNDIDFIPLYDATRAQFKRIKKDQQQQTYVTWEKVNDLENMFHAALLSEFKLTFYFSIYQLWYTAVHTFVIFDRRSCNIFANICEAYDRHSISFAVPQFAMFAMQF